MRANVCFACDIGDREADPEGGAEELLRLQVGNRLGCEEEAHHRPRRSNAEQNGNGSHHPGAMEDEIVAAEHDPGPGERKKKETVIQEGRCRFVDSADRMQAERKGGNSCDGPQKEECMSDPAMHAVTISDASREPGWQQ